MNCCDYDCNQGRDCPARVAKVGQRYPCAEALPASTLPEQLKYVAKWMLVCIATSLLYSLVLVLTLKTL